MKYSDKTHSKSIQINVTPQEFLHAINILITKPHVVNKRLWGCKLWKKIDCRKKDDRNLFTNDALRLQCILTEDNLESSVKSILNSFSIETHITDELHNMEIIIAELLPKAVSQIQLIQLILVDKIDMVVSFYNISRDCGKQAVSPDFPFEIKLKDNEVELSALCEESDKSFEWLTNTVLPQVVKWCKEYDMNLNNSMCKESLSLVSQTKYYLKYNELKLKYGKEMVKIWPECTDPSKFVYEDVAIATYLLLLWEDEENAMKKQRFVDLGCGNGLLVYILTKEGHSGVGIDVRKRNIWDMYSKEVILQEKTIVPSDSSLFPETDWLIGNHSDELTPWIPVIAAKSSYHCNFFLLPCCAYNFDGTKYQRKNSFKSQYNDYLDHIKTLCEECGFNVAIDRLKIPSTKRICLVGRGRTYTENKYNDICTKINEIINRDSQNDKSWIQSFKPREAVEKVRNCTQIDKSLISSIVKCITDYLLKDLSQSTRWDAGKTVGLGDLIKLIPQEHLKQLKSECGGLQTLLRNNHNIFVVQNGTVKLRYPKTIDEVMKSNKSGKIKTQEKPCWFYNNHPQGCPLTDKTCSFLHDKR